MKVFPFLICAIFIQLMPRICALIFVSEILVIKTLISSYYRKKERFVMDQNNIYKKIDIVLHRLEQRNLLNKVAKEICASP